MIARNQFDLSILIRILFERKKIILTVFFLVAVPVFLVSNLIKPSYDSTAVLYIERSPLKNPFYKESIVFNAPTESVDLKKHIIFLKGNYFLTKLAGELDSADTALLCPFSEEMIAEQQFLLTDSATAVDSVRFSNEVTSLIVAQLEKSIEYRVREPAIIEVHVNTNNSPLSWSIVSKMIVLYIRENLRQNREDVNAARKFLEQQKEKAKKYLTDSQDKLLRFKKRYGIRLESERIENLDINAELSRLEQDIRLARDNYTKLSDRYMEARIREEETINNIRIIDEPRIANKPSGSKKMKIRFLSILAGLILGVTSAYALEYLEDYINSEKDLKISGVGPVFGILPNLKK